MLRDADADGALEWTEADQRRADSFEQQILNVAKQLRGGHPDAIVVGFAQTLGTLMQRRLKEDPTRLGSYAVWLQTLVDRVIAPQIDARTSGTRQ